MNKFVKILLIIACIFAVLGIILIGTGALTGAGLSIIETDSGYGVNDKSLKEESNTELESFDKINIDVSMKNINIKEGSNFAIVVNYYGEKHDVQYEVKNSTLTVSDENVEKSVIDYMDMNLSFKNYDDTITIYIPSGTKLNDVGVTFSMGKLDIRELSAIEFRLESLYADVNVKNINVDKFEIKNSFSKMNCEEVESDNLNITNEFATTSIQVEGKRKDYACDLNTMFGSSRIDGNTYYKNIFDEDKSSDGKLKINNSFGTIKVEF